MRYFFFLPVLYIVVKSSMCVSALRVRPSVVAGIQLRPNKISTTKKRVFRNLSCGNLCVESGRKADLTRRGLTNSLVILQEDLSLAFWITSFASSHIGMSSVRDSLITSCGRWADSSNLVGRGLKLPAYWPGDDVGKSDVFPDSITAGRQIYRFGYTAVSFMTLGSAFASYLSSTALTVPVEISTRDSFLFSGVAAVSFGAAIASLFNPSPLSLMPGFVGEPENAMATTTGVIRRDDSIKLRARGLTKITRHPLILPVLPWGCATSYLAGGRLSEFLLFGGLATYAVAGCAAQDLRVKKKEGSVGTVFSPDSVQNDEVLDDFFRSTSFVPFVAALDGRQSVKEIILEFPLLGFCFGTFIGWFIEKYLLQYLL